LFLCGTSRSLPPSDMLSFVYCQALSAGLARRIFTIVSI